MGDNTTDKTKTPTNGVTSHSENNQDKSKLTETAKLPKLIIPADNKTKYNEKPVKTKPAKKKRRDKSDLGDNFVAPDGGWGWFVSIASGVNIVSFKN